MTHKKDLPGKKVIIIGGDGTGKTAETLRIIEQMKEKYGDNIVVMDTEGASLINIKPRDIELYAQKTEMLQTPISGKEKRRKKREQERANKKRKS
jgi:CO dehydrogenase nickel-insertion accessory protein CooC1